MNIKKPTIDMEKIEKLSKEAKDIVTQITKKNGELYASKPKNADADSKYVWRTIMFFVSNNRQLQCMPVLSDLEWWNHKEKEIGRKIDHSEKVIKIKELNLIEKEILELIPKEQWYSVRNFRMF